MTLSQFLFEHLWHFIGLLGLVACSGFFSGSETAFFSLTRADLLRFGTGASPVGHAVASLMRKPRNLLMTLLLGNQIVNVAFFAITAVIVLNFREHFSVNWAIDTLIVLAPLVLLILLGEVGPKSMAISAPAKFAQVVAVPTTVLVRALGPVQAILSVALIGPLTRLLTPAKPASRPLTAEELTSLLELSARQHQLTPNESEWLREVIGLSKIKISDIMVPRVDMVAFDADDPPAKLIALFRKTKLVRIPIHRGDLDNTLGVVHAKDLLLAPNQAIESLLRPIPYVPESATVDKLLNQFRQSRTQLAIVVDEYGGTAGLVTLEDAMEEIIGEITAPDEAVDQPVRKVGPGEYLVDGDLPIHEWAEAFGIVPPTERISTLAGLVMDVLGRVPRVGDSAKYKGVRLTVEAMRHHRVSLLRVHTAEAQP